MSTDRPTRDSMSLEEATISNMWEIAAIVELLEQKGLCTKQTSPTSSLNPKEESVGTDLEMGQRVEKGTTYRQRGCYGVKLPAASYGVLGEGESMQIN